MDLGLEACNFETACLGENGAQQTRPVWMRCLMLDM